MGKELAVRLVDVRKTYDMGGIEVSALGPIRLNIAAGEFVSFLGPTGSGWTTLLSILGCFSRPTSGRVYLGSKDITDVPEDALAQLRLRHIGFLSQGLSLIPNLTAYENIALSLTLAGVGADAADSKANRILSEVGLEGKDTALPRRLSTLEARLLTLAKSIANGPGLLVCDEPTSGLGESEALRVIGVLKRFNAEKGITVVMGTNKQAIAGRAERIVRMANGRPVGFEKMSG